MKFLIIQTASLGDTILITSIIEKLHLYYPEATLDLMVKKGNEHLFKNHPYISKLFLWDKSHKKYSSLLSLIKAINKEKYTYVLNFQRFFSTGLITVLSKSFYKRGFKKNPLARLFTKSYAHDIGNNIHEIKRNHRLINDLTDLQPASPRLYPSENDYQITELYKRNPYITIFPASIWYTKQFPVYKWVELIQLLQVKYVIYLLGSKNDISISNEIIKHCNSKNIYNYCGYFSLLQTAALMKHAIMNYANDSAPTHIASSLDAPITTIFCSTVPRFGFTPLSKNARIIETDKKLACRPCGLHGYNSCPEGHFLCARSINISKLTV